MLSLTIQYRDPNRPDTRLPPTLQHALEMYWQRLAENLQLGMLSKVGNLFIHDRAEAQELLAELKILDAFLEHSDQTDVTELVSHYMRVRISQIAPLVEAAILEWDAVECLSI